MLSSEDSLKADELKPVRQFLDQALQKKERGDLVHYNHLVQQLKVRDDPETLWRVYLGLTSCVSQLTHRLYTLKS